jgi:hypothetical protein
MSFAKVYSLYLAKVERKGRTKAELDTIICWLTGYSAPQLRKLQKNTTTFEAFFQQAPG